MRKTLIYLFILVLLGSCNMNKSQPENIVIEVENPCIKCTQKIQKETANCLKDAGNDQTKIDACNKAASENWVRECKSICEPKIPLNVLKIESADENPCIKCTQQIQIETAKCLKNAGNDQAKIDMCNKLASENWVSKCKSLCEK